MIFFVQFLAGTPPRKPPEHTLHPHQTETPDPLHDTPTRPHLRQIALQACATVLYISLAWPYFGIRDETLPWPASAWVIGGIAFLIASATRQPWWWRAIHLLFAPLAWYVLSLGIDPGWFLLAFFLLLLVFRGALSGQVPLYFSNSTTAGALSELMPDKTPLRLIDLGAGIGSIACPLARAHPEARICGIENAPATWLIGYLRTRSMKNCDWRWGSFWQANLADFDVVYAFLSPAPMPALWDKVVREMRPGTLFVSNSFAAPGIEASQIVELEDERQTRLYCYRR